MSQSYWLRFWRAEDRLGNAITGGDDEETISHRVARARIRGKWWGTAMCWFLDKWKYIVWWDQKWWDNWNHHCDRVLSHPNPSDATVELNAPLEGDANYETLPRRRDVSCSGEHESSKDGGSQKCGVCSMSR